MTITMPETHGQPLPETIEEVEAAARNRRRGAAAAYTQVATAASQDVGAVLAAPDEQ